MAYPWDTDPDYWNKQLGFGNTQAKLNTDVVNSKPIDVAWNQNQGPTMTNSQGGSTGWFGQGGYLDMGSQGLAALSGLANAYTGYKGLKLAEDQFAAEKGFANRNLANQAQQYNTGLMNSANVGLALAGSSLTPEQKQAYLQSVEKQQLSTAPVA